MKWILPGLIVLLGILTYFLWRPESERSGVARRVDEKSFRQLETCLVPQIVVDSASSSMNLSFIQSHLNGRRRVVALGESAHGSRELISWRFYYTKYLIENLGYNFIGIETTYSEAKAINSFVKGDSSLDAKAVLKSLRYPLLLNQEMVTLIEWLRDHNKKTNGNVEFFGFDIPYSTKPQENVVRYLLQTLPLVGHYADSCLATIVRNGTVTSSSSGRGYVLIDGRIFEKIEAVRRLVNANSQELIARSDAKQLEECLHSLDLIDMATKRLSSQTDMITFMNFRDSSMYENLCWVTRLDSGTSKAILWAHNEHLRRRMANRRKTLGRFLAEKLGEDFYSVGSDFGRGSFSYNSSAGVQVRSVARLNNVFSKIDSLMRLPIYYFDFRRSAQSMPMMSIVIHSITGNLAGSQPTRSRINEEFDGFVYVPKSSPLTEIRE